jgi:ATPases of the AAA+ class
MDIIHGLMKAHLTILNSDKAEVDIKKANAPDYSLDGLNIKGDVQGSISIIKKFSNYWTIAGENAEIRNMNLLLYGLPGTGKTEFAKHIARLLKRRLIIKRASDILSKWVGESEKNISQAFREAEKDKAILFIDEADSLLCAREDAGHSWEITQVNEMLTNMESFRGMLICATNFKRIVDSAAIRRFNIKLEFDYLKPEGAVTFYNLFMKNLVETPLSDQQASAIGNIPLLTPGDFKVVYQKYSFLDKKELFHDRIIDALREEIRAKNANAGKTMGFSGV